MNVINNETRQQLNDYLLGNLSLQEEEILETQIFRDNALLMQLQEVETILSERYLLEELPPEQELSFRQNYLATQQACEQLVLVTDKLVEDYLANELPAAQRQRFEQNFLAKPENRQLLADERAIRLLIQELAVTTPPPVAQAASAGVSASPLSVTSENTVTTPSLGQRIKAWFTKRIKAWFAIGGRNLPARPLTVGAVALAIIGGVSWLLLYSPRPAPKPPTPEQLAEDKIRQQEQAEPARQQSDRASKEQAGRELAQQKEREREIKRREAEERAANAEKTEDRNSDTVKKPKTEESAHVISHPIASQPEVNRGGATTSSAGGFDSTDTASFLIPAKRRVTFVFKLPATAQAQDSRVELDGASQPVTPRKNRLTVTIPARKLTPGQEHTLRIIGANGDLIGNYTLKAQK